MQLYGTPGQYRFQLVLVRVDDETEDEQVIRVFAPRRVTVRPARFMTGVGIRLPHVPIPRPGMYEFRCYLGDADEPTAVERVYAEERHEQG